MQTIEQLLQEQTFLESILNFNLRIIDSNVHFWMIRTKKGYFYNEFISNGFVALAWNIVTEKTDFSITETLKDQILLSYEDIKRPTTVINKCKSFIKDIKPGDYIVIPSAGSTSITIALAGEYYEEESKTYEIEKEVISRIEKKDVQINEVTCPYRKRRQITPLVTISSSSVDGKLLRAISNYHGISSLDLYWRNILSLLYDSYSYKANLNIIYHICRDTPIGPRVLSRLLLAMTDCWCQVVDENKISAQVRIASPGPIDFLFSKIIPACSEAVTVLGGLTIGTIAVTKPEAIPTFLKGLFSLPASVNQEYIASERAKLQLEQEKKQAPLELESKALDNLDKKLAILEHLKALGADPNTIRKAAVELSETLYYLQIESAEKPRLDAIPINDDASELLEGETAEEETSD